MNKKLTSKEIERLQDLCFANPEKACVIAQTIINACQIVSCSTFSNLTGKSPRTINYQADKLNGVKIEDRKYISFPQ